MRFQLLTVTVLALLISNTFQDQTEVEDDFQNYKTAHGKKYMNAAEEAYRASVFTSNVAIIKTHNADPTNTYTKAVNDFADMTAEEFKRNIFFLFRN
jgi:hypothetical protein